MNDPLLRELVPAVTGILVRRGATSRRPRTRCRKPWSGPWKPGRATRRATPRPGWPRSRGAGSSTPPAPRRRGGGGSSPRRLYFLCAHPDLPPSSAVALTLRAAGGLTTRQVAAAYLVPEATMAQRISRAKRRIAGLPPDQPGDLATVLRVLCLVFNEGHSGDVDLAAEAVRLTRQLAALTGEPEAAGLPALMLLHRARRASRAGPGAAWCRPASRTAHAGTLARDRLGEYQAQAAIAALHADAPSAAETDWVQVTGWYDELPRLARRGAALSRRP